MGDLPDWNTQIQGVNVQATNIIYGLDAAKPAAPGQGDVWVATDTGKVYIAFTAGTWTDITGESNPACRVYNDADITVNLSTDTLITLNSELFDNAGIHSTSTNTSRLVAPKAGVYNIFGSVQWSTYAGNHRVDIYIRLNGATIIAYQRNFNNSGKTQQTISTLYKLAAGDYVELVAYDGDIGGLKVEAFGGFSPHFGMAWVSGG